MEGAWGHPGVTRKEEGDGDGFWDTLLVFLPAETVPVIKMGGSEGDTWSSSGPWSSG